MILERAAVPRKALRNRSMDAMRGVAILLVIGHHLQPAAGSVAPAVKALFNALNYGGWIGVDLFFVLSGFLVSGLLFNEYARHGEMHPLTFLTRRGLKIYPAFYALLAVTVALGPHFPRRNLAGEVFFLQNYLGAVWNHTWSLAVEEHFYLLLVVFLFLCSRRRSKDPFRGVLGLFSVVAVVTLALRIGACLNSSPPYRTHLATHFRLDSLLFGVVLRYLSYSRPVALQLWVAQWRRPLTLVSLGLLSTAFWMFPTDDNFFVNSFGFSVLYLGSGGVLLAALSAQPPRNRFLSNAIDKLALMGVNSYSIYLWHMVALNYVSLSFFTGDSSFRSSAEATAAHIVYALLAVGGAVGLGTLAAHLIEMPILGLRDRWVVSRSGP